MEDTERHEGLDNTERGENQHVVRCIEHRATGPYHVTYWTGTDAYEFQLPNNIN